MSEYFKAKLSIVAVMLPQNVFFSLCYASAVKYLYADNKQKITVILGSQSDIVNSIQFISNLFAISEVHNITIH